MMMKSHITYGKHTIIEHYKDKDIILDAIIFSDGCELVIYGGDKPHIGAISIVNTKGEITTTEFPGHKESVLCIFCAEKLIAAGLFPAVISAGIHYDHLQPYEIQEVLKIANGMIVNFLKLN